jgi:hypothetical protein
MASFLRPYRIFSLAFRIVFRSAAGIIALDQLGITILVVRVMRQYFTGTRRSLKTFH